VFDFAVVVFGVCAPFAALVALSYSASLSDRHPSRESDNALGLFKVFGTPLLACVFSSFLDSSPYRLKLSHRFQSYTVFLHLSQEIVNKEVQHNGSQSKVCKCSLKYLRNLRPLLCS
jgi:hypothetical protein